MWPVVLISAVLFLSKVSLASVAIIPRAAGEGGFYIQGRSPIMLT
jgi:hypothetical protein